MLTDFINHTQFNHQNMFDAALVASYYMTSKNAAVATAAIAGGIALYITQPETFVAQVCIGVATSGIVWGAAMKLHNVAGKMWDDRLAKVKADYEAQQQKPEVIEMERKDKEDLANFLEQLLAEQKK